MAGEVLRKLGTIASEDPRSYSVMAVGDVEEWTKSGAGLLRTENVVFVAFHQVTHATLEMLMPEFIVSPVLSTSFDCIDLAQLLNELDYKGAYRAVGVNLPRPGMIEREIQSLCPGLDFAILRSD